MMQETNDVENPALTPAPVAVATEGGEASEPTDLAGDVIDKVCDPCGIIAHRKKKKMENANEGTTGEDLMAEARALMNSQCGPQVDDEEESAGGYFNLDCCGRAPSTNVPDKEFPAEKLPDDEENPKESPSVANNSQQTETIADIAAKLDEIDLETVAEDDVAAGEVSETTSLQKGVNVEWYKEPLYASLIVLCGIFSVTILVLAILLGKS